MSKRLSIFNHHQIAYTYVFYVYIPYITPNFGSGVIISARARKQGHFRESNEEAPGEHGRRGQHRGSTGKHGGIIKGVSREHQGSVKSGPRGRSKAVKVENLLDKRRAEQYKIKASSDNGVEYQQGYACLN